MIKIFIISLIFINSVQASPEKGKVGIEDFLQDPKIKNLSAPDYQKGAEHVADLKYEAEKDKHVTWQQNQSIDPGNLEKAGASQAMQEKVGEQIIKADRARPRFDEIINLQLINDAEKFAQNIEAELIADGSRDRVVTKNTKYCIKTCQHARKAEEHQCIKYLQEPTVEVKPAEYRNWWCRVNRHGPDDPNCQAKAYYNPPRLYKEKQVIVTPEEWVSECHALEARRAKNECKIIKEECLDEKPHVINGETIVKPCWKYQYTYECQYPVQVSCEPLLKQGCSPLNSKCIFSVNQQDEDKCYIWEQKYQCLLTEKLLKQTTKYIRPFCLEGECFNSSHEPNDDMLPAISQLGIFAQMQEDVKSDLNYIFKGATQGCNRLCLTFKDCCKLSGWGKKLKLVGCNEEEQQLADNRSKGLCVRVGKYCAERVPNTKICLRKKTNFCCFHSKLTKAIQEKGRNQLGMNFGSAKNPDCRGLTVEELTRIDFAKLDLMEAFSDLKPQLKDPSMVEQKLQQKLKELQADFKAQTKGEK
jgi:Type-1V conjugative transfer system mating pair stabilisation